MSQQNHEKLSAFMDGEHSGEDLIKQIGQDEQLHGSWQRYHLVRATLRKETPPNIDLNIASAVADALRDEPIILAPQRTGWRALPVVGNVIPMLRGAGQLAIAASVAMAVVVGVQQINQTPEIQPGGDAMPFNLGVQGGLSPVSLEQTVPVSNRYDVLEERRRINALLIDHKQQMRLKQLQTPVEEQVEQEPNSP